MPYRREHPRHPDGLDVLQTWRDVADNAQGQAVECGHFLPEEAPKETLAALRDFLLA